MCILSHSIALWLHNTIDDAWVALYVVRATALAIKRVLIANKLPGRNLVMCLECTHTHVSEINWVGGVTFDCILYSKLCRGSLHGRYRQTCRQVECTLRFFMCKLGNQTKARFGNYECGPWWWVSCCRREVLSCTLNGKQAYAIIDYVWF